MEKLMVFTLVLAGLLLVGSEWASGAPDGTPAGEGAGSQRAAMPGPYSGPHGGLKGPGPKDSGGMEAHFKACDVDGDGSLSFEEFQGCHPAGTREHFDVMDANKDGKVTADELREHGRKMMRERHAAFFDACDKNGDGSLSREEYLDCLSSGSGGPGGPGGRPGHMMPGGPMHPGPAAPPASE